VRHCVGKLKESKKCLKKEVKKERETEAKGISSSMGTTSRKQGLGGQEGAEWHGVVQGSLRKAFSVKSLGQGRLARNRGLVWGGNGRLKEKGVVAINLV